MLIIQALFGYGQDCAQNTSLDFDVCVCVCVWRKITYILDFAEAVVLSETAGVRSITLCRMITSSEVNVYIPVSVS